MKIVSTVPSQTELLFDLGLEEHIVGITKFCVHPKGQVSNIQKIGGTKNLNINRILDLSPDLIIANKEENTKEQIELLQSHTRVFISDVKTVPDALDLVTEIGELCDVEAKASLLKHKLENIYDQIHSQKAKRVLYLIWRDPLMSIGNDTYIHHMLEHMGYRNVLADQSRYPEVEFQSIKELSPDMIMLSSEPYPFKEVHLDQFRIKFPEIESRIVDAEVFSWYGSRLIHLEQEAIALKSS